MKEYKQVTFKNCKVLNVYKKLPLSLNEYILEIAIYENKNDNFWSDKAIVKIQSSNLYEELLKLKNRECHVCYLSYRLADVTILREVFRNKYVIINSPTEMSCFEYEITEGCFDEILEVLNTN